MRVAAWLLALAMPASAAPDFARLHAEVQACAVQVFLIPTARPPTEDVAKAPALVRVEQFLQPRRRVARSFTESARGLGLLWHDARHVLSTQAVLPLDEPDEQVIVVEDAAGHRQRAERLGDDARSGAVLLRLAQPVAEGHPCRWGSAAGLKLGQELVGVGNLGDLRLSLQRGHVSGLQRAVPGSLTPLIETSVRSGPGMAGGPLLDHDGQVVGVHQGIYGTSAAPGMAALALPAEALTAAAQALLAGRVSRPSSIGVWLDEGEPLDVQRFVDRPAGVRVRRVAEGSPADRAGLREGDFLLALEGRALREPVAWAQAIAWLPAGQVVRVQFQRGGQRQEIRLTPELASEP